MSWRVLYRREALAYIKRLPAKSRARITEAIELLAEDPLRRDLDIAPLRGRDDYRLRVGDYRVLYRKFDDRLVVLVVRVRSRGDVYKE